MDEFNFQLGELGFPFPAKILEKELDEQGIGFKIFQKQSAQGGMDSCVFFVKSSDVERAFAVKEKVENKDEESRLKHRHPLVKVLSYLGIGFIIYLIINELYELFT